MRPRDKSVLWLCGALATSAFLVQQPPKPEPIAIIQCSVAGLRPGDSADKARRLLGPPGDTSDDHPDADWRELHSTWVYPGGRWLSIYNGQVLGIADKTLQAPNGTHPIMHLRDVQELLGPGEEDEYVAGHQIFDLPGSKGQLSVSHHDGVVEDVYLIGRVVDGRVVP